MQRGAKRGDLRIFITTPGYAPRLSKGWLLMIQKVCDITLTVANLKRSIEFYGEVVGLRKTFETGDRARFDAGGIDLELIAGENPERPREGEPDIGFSVSDIYSAFRLFREKKVHCVEPPRETPEGGMTAVFIDPDGNRLRLVQRETMDDFINSDG